MNNLTEIEAPYDGEDFYCDEVLSGKRNVIKLVETEHVLAFQHTKPFWTVHIVVIPKIHIPSLQSIEDPRHRDVVMEMIHVIQQIAKGVIGQHGAAAVVTNLGHYQDSKHLHWHVHFGPQLR